jgi:hypothetical protein
MSLSHETIDIPLSSLADDEAALEAAVDGACYQPTFTVILILLTLNHSLRPLK